MIKYINRTGKIQDTITISTDRYEELIKAEAELEALHEGGVDNWIYYWESLRDAGYFTRFGVD